MDLSVGSSKNTNKSLERSDRNMKNKVSEVDVKKKLTNEENGERSKSESSETGISEVMNVILGDTESSVEVAADTVESDEEKVESGGGLGKYSMPLESERGLYITGATILAMKGIITYKEYMTNQYEKHIPQDFLDKKFYLGDILGAIRGMTRLKLAMCKDRHPSVTMFDHMKKEEDELVANGCMFVTDSEESGNEEQEEGEESTNKKLKQKITSKKSLVKSSQKQSSLKRVQASSSQTKVSQSQPKINQKRVETECKKNTVMETKDKENVRSNNDEDKDNELPHELLQCGGCGINISSLQHLDRHLERCRGAKRKQSTESHSKRAKTFHTNTAADQLATTSGVESNQDVIIGKLYVCDTDDGEIINGWEECMQGIPPGPACPRCAFEVPTLYDLPLHQRFHTGSEKITCPLCPFLTKSIPVYLIHVEEHAS